MKKLTLVQLATMEFCKKQIDEARKENIDINNVKKKDYLRAKQILDAQNGIVYTPGGNCTIRTLKALEKYGLLKYIDLVISSAEENVSKPDRRIFEIALNRGGCLPDRAVMVGDRIDNDVIPAKKLGMHTVWIKQGYGKYWNITNDIETPDCSVDSLTELCKIL